MDIEEVLLLWFINVLTKRLPGGAYKLPGGAIKSM